ncbi:ABC transporter ATP-binding protein [Latilactobacillus curvatus]|nr:ABC transporter ATP-binding protein [Latilactobacillus curvatus]MCT3525348.1 ABC transporter ATP-binding protein [Latilactobacillus curvatus]MCT3533241.1 ABC transporter ATP-binding protein [Latilactobacillus curvatus]
MVNTILKEADLFCPNSVRINFTIYLKQNKKSFISCCVLNGWTL